MADTETCRPRDKSVDDFWAQRKIDADKNRRAFPEVWAVKCTPMDRESIVSYVPHIAGYYTSEEGAPVMHMMKSLDHLGREEWLYTLEKKSSADVSDYEMTHLDRRDRGLPYTGT